MPEERWLVRGLTSGNIEGQRAGLTEWQFSDGPPGSRRYSEDYTSLEEGLAAHSGCVIHYDPDA